jgi:hypothetical protein
LHVRGDEDPIDINDIVHLRVPTDDLGDCADLEFEDWVGIAEPIDPSDINLFPNPADDQVELVINRPGAHQIDVWSATGQRVLSMQTTAMVEKLEASHWAPGIYLVNIAQGDHHAVVRLAIQ